jgi:putative membrane protein
MNRSLLLSALLFASIFFSCNSQENNSNKEAQSENKEKFDSTNTKSDADFAVKAYSGGLTEVELGKLAATNGLSQQVKDFGNTMVTDHSKANDELRTTAASKNITLPAVPNSKNQKDIDDLKQKKGADFDKAYMDMMVSDHKDDIDEFQKEADKGNDADLKAWAGGKVPTLQHHLQMAQDVQNQVKNSK